MDIMEPVPYVRIASGYALLGLVLPNLNNSNIQNISRASNSCGNPLFSWMFWTSYTKNQVIKHANFVLRWRSNLIGVAKERRFDHRRRESGAKQFQDGPKFMLKLASWPKPLPQRHNDVNFQKLVWKCSLRWILCTHYWASSAHSSVNVSAYLRPSSQPGCCILLSPRKASSRLKCWLKSVPMPTAVCIHKIHSKHS